MLQARDDTSVISGLGFMFCSCLRSGLRVRIMIYGCMTLLAIGLIRYYFVFIWFHSFPQYLLHTYYLVKDNNPDF